MREKKGEGEDADLDAIMKDVAALKTDIGKLMDHAKTGAADTVNGEVRRFYDSLSAEGERSVTAIAHRVEERPFASLLIAFAAGFIGSRILMR